MRESFPYGEHYPHQYKKDQTPCDADQQEAFKVLSSINTLADDIRKHILLEETVLEGHIDDTKEGTTLSAREKEILVCVARGMINKEIADHLNISIHTVITHRKNIVHKQVSKP